jgi:hypothetical protein
MTLDPGIQGHEPVFGDHGLSAPDPRDQKSPAKHFLVEPMVD